MPEKENIYSNLVDDIELKDLFILESSMKREENFYPPAKVSIETECEYQNTDGGFKAYIKYSLKATEKKKKQLGFSIYVEYLVIYNSKTEMTDDLFKEFSNTTLVIETWPYFRQYVHTTTLIFGLPSLVLQLKVSHKPKQTSKNKKS